MLDTVLLRVKDYRSRSETLGCQLYQAIAKQRETRTAVTAACSLTLKAQRDICSWAAELLQGGAALNFIKIMQKQLN